jgi:hypothetical protein
MEPPLALHAGPGVGLQFSSVRTIYLAVYTQDPEARPLVPKLREVVASELRAAGPVDVVLLADRGVDCATCSDWVSLCSGYQIPMLGGEPGSVVVLCELEELDPYLPIRLGMSLSVRRLEDGEALASAQGIWAGSEEPFTPPQAFHWPWHRPPAQPPIELQWDARVEAASCADVMRRAARDCVQTLMSSSPATVQASLGAEAAGIPELGPALPPPEFNDATPSEPPTNGSVESIPPAPDPSL